MAKSIGETFAKTCVLRSGGIVSEREITTTKAYLSRLARADNDMAYDLTESITEHGLYLLTPEQNAKGIAHKRHRCRVILRHSMDETLRLLAEGKNLLLRPAAAAAQHSHATQHKRRRHELHEAPARHRVARGLPSLPAPVARA